MLSRVTLLAALLVVVPATSRAQNDGGLSVSDFPIVKPGLWETAVSGGGSVQRVRSCIADDRVQTAANLANVPAGCTATSKTHTSTTYSIDMTCSAKGVSFHNRVRMSMPDDDHVHSVMTVTRSGQGSPVRVTTDSHFVRSDCGGLSPGKGQMMH